MATGRCNCGAVAFEIDAEPEEVIICHCSICRRATGSNGIAVVLVMNEDFRWTHGENHINSWRKPDGDWEMPFCTTCGSPLPGFNDGKRIYVPAGLITDGGESLKVTNHIFVDSKAHWDVIGDDGRQHREDYEP